MKRLALTVIAGVFVACGLNAAGQAKEIRIGQFPNVTHAQALMARASGEYEKALGVPIQWTTFNAGPSAIEALFTGAIDATYIGPNPAINGFVKSGGESFQIVAGSASGGAALVIRSDSGIEGEKDFDGKTVATPQLGNTQDVAARAWLKEKGYKLKERGGTVTVLPLANPDQLLMFQRREIDAAWTVEPWVSRLEQEAGGRVLLDEGTLWPDGKYVTTVLVVSRKFIRENPELVKKLVRAHVELTRRIQAGKQAALPVINAEILKQTSRELPVPVLESALGRVTFTCEPLEEALYKTAHLAHEAGFLREEPKLAGIYNLKFLNEVLAETQDD